MRNFLNTAVLTFALAVTGGASAQQPNQQTESQQQQNGAPMHHADPAKEARHLSKQLGLNADQTSQIQAILADREQREQTLMASNADRKAMHQQRRAIMQDTQSKINAILTPAQQQQYATMQSERRQHGQPGGQPTAATPPPALS